MDLTADQVREELRDILSRQNMSQRSLAKLIGVSGQFLNEVLLGSREPTGLILEYLGFDRIVIYRDRKRRGAPRA